MRRVFSIILICSSWLVQAQELVYFEDFSTNTKGWITLKSNIDDSKFHNGTYYWEHNDLNFSTINQYISQLDDREDFEIVATFRPYKMGSEYGLFWGGVNKDNANYVLFKGKKYKNFQLTAGKLSIDNEWQTSMYIRMDENRISIKKKGKIIEVWINDTKLYEQSVGVLMGKGYGFVVSGNTEIAIDNFMVKGIKIPINVSPDLFYSDLPENLGANINTAFDEMTPVITPNGKGIFFSRKFSPDNVGGSTDYQDIYYSELFEGKWTNAFNIGKPLNNHGPNAVCAVTPDGNKLLLMNTYNLNGEAKGAGLSISEKTNAGWSIPEDVRIKGYYNRSEFNEFVLTNDGKTMILAIDRNDTYGTRDLYVTFSEGNGYWSTPLNMGATLNTPGTELSPFIASDGVTLYFSSTGHPGYGKNDMFMTKRLDDSWTKWSEPKNLGKPLNSEGVEAYYTIAASGEYAYYVSTKNAFGENDVFRIKLPSEVKPEPVVLIKGYVLNSKTKEAIATPVHYEDLDNGKDLGLANSDPITGYYEMVLPLNNVYSLFAEKNGFYSVRDNLDLSQVQMYQEVERNLYLSPIEIGQSMQLNNVFFYRGKAMLESSSYAELDKLVKMLKENPSMEIELEGHTDNQGDADLNTKLSEDRVFAVKDYLVNKGIETARIMGKGWGGEKPIASNDAEITRKLNRRVEFKILKK